MKQSISVMLAAALLIPFGLFSPGVKADAAADPSVTVYHETFANGAGKAVQSGGAKLEAVTGKSFSGNEDGSALYVSNRTNNWDGADFKFSDLNMANGKTYSVTVSTFVDPSVKVPSGAQAFLQTVDSYGWLAGADFKAGTAAVLTKEFTVDTSKDKALRIQSNDEGSTVPFYIGDILITEKAASGGGEDTDPSRPKASAFSPITFEDQKTGGFEGRAGTETLTITKEANHTEGGSYALKVEGRTNTWQALPCV